MRKPEVPSTRQVQTEKRKPQANGIKERRRLLQEYIADLRGMLQRLRNKLH